MGPVIDEYPIYENRTVSAGEHHPWEEHALYNQKPIPQNLQDSLEYYRSVSFVVVKDGQLVHEQYWDGWNEATLSNSWSMAKSIVSVLIGMAIDDGYIQGVDQKVGDFIPEFTEGKNADLTIEHLLKMSSGIPFDEHYMNPFGYMAKALYGNNLRSITLDYDVETEPNTVWHYTGGNTLLLSFIIKKATGIEVSEYASRKLWRPLGAKHDALWSLDHKGGDEKSFCCFNSNAKDFARIGQLYLQKGQWRGKQLISSDYVAASISPMMKPDKYGIPADHYGYAWWLGNHQGMPFFFARGIKGQYIFVFPEKNLVAVRLGHTRSKYNVKKHPTDVYAFLDAALAVSE